MEVKLFVQRGSSIEICSGLVRQIWIRFEWDTPQVSRKVVLELRRSHVMDPEICWSIDFSIVENC